jgi:hypothetical protein
MMMALFGYGAFIWRRVLAGLKPDARMSCKWSFAMRKNIVRMVSLLALIGAKPAIAMDYIGEHVPNAQKVGQARMSVLLWDVYDAKLLAPEGKWQANAPFALQLTYLRHLDGVKIADRAVQEMRKQGFDDEIKLATWHTQMREIFPDVYDGDTLTGIFTQDGETIFLNDGSEIGRIQDPDFAKRFSAIWLSPKTSAPDLRLALFGQETLEGQTHHENTERTGSRGTSHLY